MLKENNKVRVLRRGKDGFIIYVFTNGKYIAQFGGFDSNYSKMEFGNMESLVECYFSQDQVNFILANINHQYI